VNRILIVVAAAFILVAPSAILAQETQVASSASDAIASSACSKVYTYGSGATQFNWCPSLDGNLMMLAGPGGTSGPWEHIRNAVLLEGYAICATGLAPTYDAGYKEANLLASSIIYDYTTSFKVQRSTADAKFYITHYFTRNPVERSVTVTVYIKNTSGLIQYDVKYSRYVDYDIDFTTGDDIFDKSADGVWARNADSPYHAATLTGVTWAVAHNSYVESFNALDAVTYSTCSPATAATPTVVSDWTARVTYNIGTLKPNYSKSFKFVYRIQ